MHNILLITLKSSYSQSTFRHALLVTTVTVVSEFILCTKHRCQTLCLVMHSKKVSASRPLSRNTWWVLYQVHTLLAWPKTVKITPRV